MRRKGFGGRRVESERWVDVGEAAINNSSASVCEFEPGMLGM